MSATWVSVRLGELLRRVKNEVLVSDDETYARLTIRMNGKGIVIRDRVPGHEIGTKRQFLARSGQLLLSKIDARNGAFGIVPIECDKAVITGNFWAFDVNASRLVPGYFDYLTKTPLFVEFCIRASEGTTNRLYLQETAFLSQEIPLPPISEQRRIVAKIDELTAKIEKASDLRRKASEGAEALIESELSRTFHIISQHFGSTQIGNFSEVKGGKRLPAGERLSDNPTPFPYIRVADMKKHSIDTSGLKYVPEHLHPSISRYTISSRDVYVTIAGTIGYPGVVPEILDGANLTENAAKLVFHNDERISKEYIVYSLRSPQVQQQFKKKQTEAAQPKLALHRIASTQIPIPPLPQQRRIVAYLDSLQAQVDALKKLQAQTAAELDALFPSILDRAFKGGL
jgi:type I restriction enzyme S subunit